MSYERQDNRLSPPPTYAEAAPGGMDSEIYIDGTLYVDGVPVSNTELGRRSARRNQRQENPCAKLFRFVRSKLLLICFSN